MANKLYPLTLPQLSFYYDYLLLKNDCKYNMGGYLLLNGSLDLDVFTQAYKYTLQKQDISKLRFVVKEEELLQYFEDDFEPEIFFLDYRNEENPVDKAINYVLAENRKPFPFAGTPLFYDVIIQTAQSQYVWFPRFHHFSNDGYGRSIITNSISLTYNSLINGKGYPELKSYSYLDFLEDDLKYRQSAEFINSSDYWKEKLTPLPEPISFTIKKHSIRDISLKTEHITLNLHRMCYSSLIRTADLCGSTPFQALLAILYITLYKLYGSDDIVVGMPVLNRSNHKFKNTSGLFMNMTMLRMYIDPARTLSDFLEVVRFEIKECYRHQRIPLSEIFRHFRHTPGFRNELFDVTIVYRKMDFSQKLGENKLNAVTLDTQVRNESLGIEIDEYDDEDNVNIFFNYNPLVFSENEAVYIAKSFEKILLELIYFPEKPISEIKFLDEFERFSIINTYNRDAFKGRTTDSTITERFEEIVLKYPDKTAVTSDEGSLTYSEIGRKSDEIADALVTGYKVAKGDIVCLAVERAAQTMAAILGIMKAGAVCLPAEISNPPERISSVIRESKSVLTIVDNALLLSLPGRVVLLDSLKSVGAGQKAEITQKDLAYIIYTSGSTGIPKGVMIEHGSFMSMFINAIEVFGVNEKDKVLQFASFGFDAAIFEIFQALLTGAELVIAGKKTIRDPNLFIKFIDDNRVSVATLPPAYLNALEQPLFPHLSTLITAGDKASAKDVNHYCRYKRVINAYGPTEASVCASYFLAKPEDEYSDLVPIGKPVAGSSIYIMNTSLELLPPGFEGELCISGPNLARGYLGNEELTKSKFVSDPFFPGRKMYLSGDSARWLPDGNIEFLGRTDNQLKIKGNRVEPGETECHLKNIPQIKDAQVLDVDIQGTKELAAFLITTSAEINEKEIRLYLKDFLPDYMIPEYFQKVDSYPLNNNGKIDKVKLRQSMNPLVQKSGNEAIEMSDAEKLFVPCVSEVLGVEQPGPDDNFFDFGCDSLKIARLITRIKKDLDFEISFKTIFDNPTIRGMAVAVKPLESDNPEQRVPVVEKEYYPLSSAQKRLWILSQDKANASVYNMPVPLLLEGDIDTELLAQSVKIVIERHDILRTTYPEIDGNPYQMINSNINCVFTKIDLSEASDSEAQAISLVNKAIASPFDISREVPVRVLLLRTGHNKCVFLMVIHHIAGDGISISILMEEISRAYCDILSGYNKPVAEPVKAGYKDYSVYEQKLIQSNIYQQQKRFWSKRLKAPLQALNLPCDKPRPAVKTYSGQYKFSSLESSLSESIIKFSRDNHVSNFTVLLSAVNILLSKYSGQDEIMTGMPLSGRNLLETEKMIGLFLNTVVLRNKINSQATFRQQLSITSSVMSEAVSNGDYPFDLLVRDLDPERDTSRAPLFDVLIQYQNQDVTDLKIKGVNTSFYSASMPFAKFDLTFTFAEKCGGIDFSIGYNTNLFFGERIDRMAGHLINILSQVVRNPEITIGKISLPGSLEKKAIYERSSGKRTELEEKSVIELFEKQVFKNPGNTALVFNEKRLTYRELYDRVNILSLEIQKTFEVSCDDIIAIIGGRSEMFVTAILAVLTSGAAYMPVDPDLPPERIRFMLRESRTQLILTDGTAGIENILAPAPEVKVRVLDMDFLPGNQSREFASCKSDPSSLAYLLYTSGSTGVPKGVMIEHKSLSNLLTGLKDAVYCDCSSPLNFALVSPFVFDASVKQMFFALANGHCLDIVPDEIRLNGRKLLEFYKDHKIDVSDGTPVHLEILLEELSDGEKRYLPRKFVIGGQQLMYATVKKLLEVAGDNQLVVNNVYGPTECCDVSSSFEITKETISNCAEDAYGPMPIGKPLNNVSVYIADTSLMPVPAGIEGELCISGAGVARGYAGRKDLTDEKFVYTEFEEKRRVYKTGDTGRFLESGDILLTGRCDDQIKLRGFRIELSEIESCLKEFEKIKSAAVSTVGEGTNLEIAAYFTSNEQFPVEELRQHISCRLPSYMMPSYFTQLDKMPLSANGKTDKKSLPQPVRQESAVNAGLPPSDILEEKLCAIWEDLLMTGAVGVNDNFFNLGGHSLTAIRLISRIHRDFNVEAGIWEIFQYPTVSGLANLIRSKNPSFFNPIPSAEKRDYYPLSHSQRRLWVLSKMEGQNSLYNIPAALLLKGPLDITAFEKAFAAVVERHESFRTSFFEIEGEPFQRILDRVDFKVENEVFKGVWDGDTLRNMAEEYFRYEFDLSAAPLLRIKLVELSGNNWLFLFNMHHIIGDGWSVDIILKEFQIYYDSFLNNKYRFPAPLRVHYKDYAQWQNQILKDSSLNSVKEYWHKKLAKPRPEPDLPLDFKRGPSFTLDGELLKFELSEDLTKKLKKTGVNCNSSLYMVLLSAVNILLYKYSSEEDIIVGSPVAGRQHYDLDNQVGFYINTLVLRNKVNPGASFNELLGQVNRTLSEALDNQIYPFDKLVNELDVERIPDRNPLFDVMAAWMVKDGMEMKFSFNSVEATGLNFPITKSMFDLSFLFEENRGRAGYSIEYNTSLFRQGSIFRMARHFEKLLEEIVSNPVEKVENINIISDPEQKELLYGINETTDCDGTEAGVMELFFEQVSGCSNRVALVSNHSEITYGELDRLSDNLAFRIKEILNITVEDIVTVIVDDPCLAVTSLLAVMKTGAAYLPVSPDTPPERIRYILEDSKSGVILTDCGINVSGKRVIDLREQNDINARELHDINVTKAVEKNNGRKFSAVKNLPEDLAYVIYTSGSTGTPKGVMIEHKSLNSLILSLKINFYSSYSMPLKELMISSFAFDVSIKQIFAALCNGNTIHIPDSQSRMDPRVISGYIVRNGINVVDLTPSFFAVMLEEGFARAEKPELYEIFLGSEPLPSRHLESFYSNGRNRRIRITNFYGPTECCVESAFFRTDPGDLNYGCDIVPIGKPVLNEQIYILGKNLELCPKGVSGEICIGGKGLAREYLNDSERTREKFVPFPLMNRSRIYKTGDLGRIRYDGNIEFLGRIDNQVKIRGYRVELEEIEQCINKFDQIQECVVVLTGKNGNEELATYYTSGKEIKSSELRAHIERYLPKYMLPSHFVRLDAIPLTSSGKVNKKMLPDPVTEAKTLFPAREPKDEAETSVLNICRRVLENDSVSIEDNFFEAGGNSLNAVRMISRIESLTGVGLSLRDVFYNPVLQDLAMVVKKAEQNNIEKSKIDESKTIIPASEEELKLLCNLQFEDEE